MNLPAAMLKAIGEIVLINLLLLPAILRGQGNEAEFMTGDSAFVAREALSSAKITEGERLGWTQQKADLRFGSFGISIARRLDPATGLPPPKNMIWGDSFIGIIGKKPASYMSGNWSPWSFLDAEIKLKGEDKPLPSPTLSGALVYAGISEIRDDRIVAEAIWKDISGGFLRARFFGWRGNVSRFGMALSYFPADGRTLESICYNLICQPYDLSDRGYWERSRQLAVPGKTIPFKTGEKLCFSPADPLRFVYYNRFAHNDSGVTLALSPYNLSSVEIEGQGRDLAQDSNRSSIRTSVRPAEADAEVRMLLGDWVEQAHPIAVAGFFAEENEIRKELDDLKEVELFPMPSAPPDFSELIKSTALSEKFGEKLRGLQSDHREGLDVFQAKSSVGSYVRVQELRSKLLELSREMRETWIKDKLFSK